MPMCIVHCINLRKDESPHSLLQDIVKNYPGIRSNILEINFVVQFMHFGERQCGKLDFCHKPFVIIVSLHFRC